MGFYIRQLAILVTAFAFFSINYTLYFFLSWFPTYLVNVRHMTLSTMSMVTVIPWAFDAVGLVSGGSLMDYAATRMDKLMSRKLVLGVFLGLSAVCIGFAGVVSTVTSAVTLMSLAVLFMYIAAVVPWVIIQDLVEPGCVGRVGGFNHMLANLGGLLSPLITGFIVEGTGSFSAAFVLAGVIGIVAVIGVAIALRPIPLDSFANSKTIARS